MTDKSESASARPPMPSLAPPTDDIDSEWGADEIPAAAPVPASLSGQVAPAPSTPPQAAAAPSAPPRASSPPALATPRPSSPPRPVSTTSSAPPAAGRFNSKQTLLGMAPPKLTRSEPPAVAPSAPPVASTPPAAAPATGALGKQTLLGIAPVVARSTPPSAEPAPAAAVSAPTTPEPQAAAASDAAESAAASVPNIAAAPIATVATDAPITSEISTPEVIVPRTKSSSPQIEIAATDELHSLAPKRRGYVWLLAAAAVILLGIVGLRALDRPPEQLPATMGRPVVAKKAEAAAALAGAKRLDEDDDDDGDDPPSSDDEPEPSPGVPDADPLAKARAVPAPAASTPTPVRAAAAAALGAATATTAEPSPAPSAAAPSGDVVRINVSSEPAGARLFWRGKEVGTTPFVLELQPGEKHAYELGLPGYTTRKVVIDGTKTDISVGLRPDPSTSTFIKR